jgi:gluconolactonase
MRFFAAAVLLLAFTARMTTGGEDYPLTEDSKKQPGVPEGKMEKQEPLTSKIINGSVHDWSIYVPAQYDPNTPACVMVFQDHGGAEKFQVVFDNLIHKKEMPVTIGIAISPGRVPTKPAVAGGKSLPRQTRSYEYDSITDRYARFVIEEVLPKVEAKYNITKDPNGRAICGGSSGAICAFTVAFWRPDQFRRVVSFIGSYTNLRNAQDMSSLVRKYEPRPIRVFMQDGDKDLSNYAGDWWVANLDMVSAFKYMDYDHVWVPGTGGHDGKQRAAVFPDALRFIWKDYPKPIEARYPIPPDAKVAFSGSKLPLLRVIEKGEDWKLLGEGYKFTEGPAPDDKGNVFFTDSPNDKIHKIDAEGKISVFVENAGGPNGAKFGPDGKLYVCQSKKRQIGRFTPEGKEEVVAEDIDCNDLVVSHKGHVYVTDHVKRKIWLIPEAGQKKEVDTGLNFPNGLCFTPDQSQLLVADMKSPHVFAFTIEEDGTLANKMPFYLLHVPPEELDSGVDGICVDAKGYLYCATRAGVQMSDQAGRVVGIMDRPQRDWIASITFGGPNLEYIYAMSKDKVYRRKTKTSGVLYYKEPVQPPSPQM